VDRFFFFFFFTAAPSPKGRDCPFAGRYEISGGLNAEDVGKALAASRPGSENNPDKPTPCNPPGKQYLTVGCNSPDTMEFQSECGTKTVAGKPNRPCIYFMRTTFLSHTPAPSTHHRLTKRRVQFLRVVGSNSPIISVCACTRGLDNYM
jgi:hypothetical protein